MRQEEARSRAVLEQRKAQYRQSMGHFKQVETTRERRETTQMHQEEQHQKAYAQYLWVVAADRKNAVSMSFIVAPVVRVGCGARSGTQWHID